MGLKHKAKRSTLTPEEESDLATFRAQMVDGAVAQADRFDKAVLTVGTLTFAASIGFISWLERISAPIPKEWAVATWVLMPLAIAAVMATFYLSKVAAEASARRVDELVATPALYTEDAFGPNRAHALSHALHLLSGLLFLAGLATFAGLLISGLVGAPTQ